MTSRMMVGRETEGWMVCHNLSIGGFTTDYEEACRIAKRDNALAVIKVRYTAGIKIETIDEGKGL